MCAHSMDIVYEEEQKLNVVENNWTDRRKLESKNRQKIFVLDHNNKRNKQDRVNNTLFLSSIF